MRVEFSSVQFLVEQQQSTQQQQQQNNNRKKEKKILNDIPNTNYIIIIDTSYQLHITKHRN